MEVNYKNCARYKCFLDTDEQIFKNKSLSIRQIKDLKAFKYKGFKEKLQVKRIENNKQKLQQIKKAELDFFTNKNKSLTVKFKI